MNTDRYWSKKKGQQLFEEAILLESEGKAEEAVDAYFKSVEHCPRNAQAHYNLGIALATTGRLDQAFRAWKRAIWLEPVFKNQLAIAFDIDHELQEEVIEDLACDNFQNFTMAA